MFTVEFDSDSVSIISMDESDSFEDVEVIIGDDNTVFIRQFDDHIGEHQLIYMSYQQLLDLFTAMSRGEGMFRIIGHADGRRR
jgi:hypothetical protein